jgi:hypothetical protein
MIYRYFVTLDDVHYIENDGIEISHLFHTEE